MGSFQGRDGIELLDWLFDQNDGILRHEETGHHGSHHTWPAHGPNVRETVIFGVTHAFLFCFVYAVCDLLDGMRVLSVTVWSPQAD